MTAEVAIANSSAIALAADSAVTIGEGKIYNSALKLFSLSKVAPVGVMVYGSATLMGVPWELLVKTYRKELAGDTHGTLAEYAERLISYLDGNTAFFPEDFQEKWILGNVRSYFELIRDECFDALKKIFEENGRASIAEIRATLSEIVNDHHAKLSQNNLTDGMTDDFANDFRTEYLDNFKKLRKSIFEKVDVSGATASKLYDIAIFINTRKIYSNGVSGLVVAGYGESEIYPNIITYDVEGVVINKLKYSKNDDKSHKISSGSECSIIPFAQEDMVSTFMSGINLHVLNFLQSYLGKMFDRLPELLGNNNSTEEKKKFKSQIEELLEGFTEEFKKHLRDEHSRPVLQMTTVLPKDELAEMAEALVNLTAFKRRISTSIETVGGPIDVVVISKGDGLIWVKRKHYFPRELNQQFFANYFREVNNGD